MNSQERGLSIRVPRGGLFERRPYAFGGVSGLSIRGVDQLRELVRGESCRACSRRRAGWPRIRRGCWRWGESHAGYGCKRARVRVQRWTWP